jgi:hypothetical protein
LLQRLAVVGAAAHSRMQAKAVDVGHAGRTLHAKLAVRRGGAFIGVRASRWLRLSILPRLHHLGPNSTTMNWLHDALMHRRGVGKKYLAPA